MRPYVLRALVQKEVRRHLLNRGGLALAGLMVGSALLLSLFDPTAGGSAGGREDAAATGGLVGGVHHCYVFAAQETWLTAHLRANVPPELRDVILVRQTQPGNVETYVTAGPGVGSIVLHQSPGADGRPTLGVEVWHPDGDPGAMAGYEAWFWKELRRGLQAQAAAAVRAAGRDPAALPEPRFDDGDLWAVLESYRTLSARADDLSAGGSRLPAVTVRRVGRANPPLDLRNAVATAMVVFALYFACVYLLPMLTCEERERGALLAQALSPASPAEILTAKFLFYPTLGVALAATLAGITKPAVLTVPFFWLSLFAVACGFLGLGMTIATLAKTQRAAFLGSMCYLMSVAMVLTVCQQNGIPGIPYLALEYHGPRVLHAAIVGEVKPVHWQGLLATAGLASGWIWLAGVLFRKHGWQ
jgi:hypothetical protein